MATLRNNPGLFSGGAVTLNTQPDVAFYAQLLAHKQAKEDAITDYYRKLPSTINDAGMRDRERPILNQKVADIMDYSMKNRNTLANPRLDNGKAQYELEQKYREAHQLINESKQRGQTSLELGKLRFQQGNDYIFDDPDFMNQVHAHDLPIGAEGSKSIDLATITMPVKPFGTKEQDQFYKTAIGDYKPKKLQDIGKAISDTRTGELIIPYSTEYSPDQIKGIAYKANQLVTEDKSAKRHYQNLMHDPDFYHAATQAYQSVFGATNPDGTPNIVDSPEKAAQADLIIKAKGSAGSGTDRITDPNSILRRELTLMAAQEAKEKRMHEFKQGTDETWIDNYANKLKENGTQVLSDFGQGVKISIDPVLEKAFTRGTGKNAVTPDEFIITNDDKYIPIYYQYDASGKVETDKKGRNVVDKALSVPLSSEQFKLVLGKKSVTPGQISKEMRNTSPASTYHIKGKTYSEKELLDMGYTLDQIKAYKK